MFFDVFWDGGKNIFMGGINILESEMIIISRVARKYKNSSFFHVIVQGINKEYIFEEEIYKEKYLSLINKFSNEMEVYIISYCIMDNHAHLLMKINNIENLSRLMQKVNSIYAKYYNYKKNRVGYVFRDRFLSETINDKKYFIQCIKYIHLNPVKAGIVKNSKDYKYSSYNNFFNIEDIKINLLISKILNKDEYLDICNSNNYEISFLDIKEEHNIDQNIKYGIREYTIINKYDLYKIFEDRQILKEMIKFLKQRYEIKYVDIQKFFGMKRGTMDSLKM